jgi:hypothetical protein
MAQLDPINFYYVIFWLVLTMTISYCIFYLYLAVPIYNRRKLKIIFIRKNVVLSIITFKKK